MNRVDRLSAILIQLQTRRVTRAQDIADRFDISLRTVYRDIKALEEGGIPIIGEAGVGYSLVEGYRLPPVMFTREEAAAFLTAEKLVEKLTDKATSSDYTSAMYKIKAVLKAGEKDFLESMDSHIEVIKSRRQLRSRSDLNLLPLLLKSISEKRAVEINYFTYYRQEKTHRFIEPIGVLYLDNFWHAIAFCRMRGAIRDFRLDRIEDLRLTDETYRYNHPSLQEYLKNGYKEQPLHEIVIAVDKKIHTSLEDQKYYHGFVSELAEKDYVLMNFFTNSICGFARWFLMFADQARIIKSDLLKEQVRELNLKISLNLEQFVEKEL